jgi:thiosulfate/3-mercaptopyruvate sulfurtransferase
MSGPLITAEELKAALGTVKTFDLRWSVTDPQHGIAAYRRGHIPGAVFVDLDHHLAAPAGPGRHPLPALDDFETTLGSLGLTSGETAVVYDDTSGSIAARMWWMLRAVGHDDIRLLDGGFRAWEESGFPVETGEVTPEPGSFHALHDFVGQVDRSGLDGRLVVDVRATERYTGEYEPIDPKAGHIPGAVNIPISASLDSRGAFLGPAALADVYSNLDDPVLSCGSGVNACHTALAMTLAGLPMPDIYVGSFSDWSSQDLPVNTGLDP